MHWGAKRAAPRLVLNDRFACRGSHVRDGRGTLVQSPGAGPGPHRDASQVNLMSTKRIARWPLCRTGVVPLGRGPRGHGTRPDSPLRLVRPVPCEHVPRVLWRIAAALQRPCAIPPPPPHPSIRMRERRTDVVMLWDASWPRVQIHDSSGNGRATASLSREDAPLGMDNLCPCGLPWHWQPVLGRSLPDDPQTAPLHAHETPDTSPPGTTSPTPLTLP